MIDLKLMNEFRLAFKRARMPQSFTCPPRTQLQQSTKRSMLRFLWLSVSRKEYRSRCEPIDRFIQVSGNGMQEGTSLGRGSGSSCSVANQQRKRQSGRTVMLMKKINLNIYKLLIFFSTFKLVHLEVHLDGNMIK